MALHHSLTQRLSRLAIIHGGIHLSRLLLIHTIICSSESTIHIHTDDQSSDIVALNYTPSTAFPPVSYSHLLKGAFSPIQNASYPKLSPFCSPKSSRSHHPRCVLTQDFVYFRIHLPHFLDVTSANRVHGTSHDARTFLF
jgi:hypothetical protein